jgi:hypothetical protein
MTRQEMLQVAKTIKSQIHPTVLMSAAARKFGAYTGGQNMYGLHFKISNTSKIKYGIVTIVLNHSDLYNIKIYNKIGRELYSINDIYFDDLNTVLENAWEKKEVLKTWNPKIPTIQFSIEKEFNA